MKNMIVKVLTLLLLTTAPTFLVMAESTTKPKGKDDSKQVIEKQNHNKANNSHDLNNQKPLEKRRGGKPPQPAIDICLSQKESSLCVFQGPRSLEEGVCEFTPDKQYFACKPDRKEKQNQSPRVGTEDD